MTKSCASRHSSRFSAGDRTPLQLRAHGLLGDLFSQGSGPVEPIFTAEQLQELQQAADEAEAAAADVASGAKRSNKRKGNRLKNARSSAASAVTAAAAAAAAVAALRASASSPNLLDSCGADAEDDLSFVSDLLLPDDPHLLTVLGPQLGQQHDDSGEPQHTVVPPSTQPAAAAAAAAADAQGVASECAAAGAGVQADAMHEEQLPAAAAAAASAEAATGGVASPPPPPAAAACPTRPAQPLATPQQQQEVVPAEFVPEAPCVVRNHSGALLLSSPAPDFSSADCVTSHTPELNQAVTADGTDSSTKVRQSDSDAAPAAAAVTAGPTEDLMAVDQILADMQEDCLWDQQFMLLDQQKLGPPPGPAPAAAAIPSAAAAAAVPSGFSFQALLMSDDPMVTLPLLTPEQQGDAGTDPSNAYGQQQHMVPLLPQQHFTDPNMLQLHSMAANTLPDAAAAAAGGGGGSETAQHYSSTTDFTAHQMRLMMMQQGERVQLQTVLKAEERARRKAEKKRQKKLQKQMEQQYHLQQQQQQGMLTPFGMAAPPLTYEGQHNTPMQLQPPHLSMQNLEQQQAEAGPSWQPPLGGRSASMHVPLIPNPQHTAQHTMNRSNSSTWPGSQQPTTHLPSAVAADLASHGPPAAPAFYPTYTSSTPHPAPPHRHPSARYTPYTQGPARYNRTAADHLAPLPLTRAASYGSGMYAAGGLAAATAAEAAGAAAAPRVGGLKQSKSSPLLLLPGVPVAEGGWVQERPLEVLQGVVVPAGSTPTAAAAAAAPVADGAVGRVGAAVASQAPGGQMHTQQQQQQAEVGPMVGASATAAEEHTANPMAGAAASADPHLSVQATQQQLALLQHQPAHITAPSSAPVNPSAGLTATAPEASAGMKPPQDIPHTAQGDTPAGQATDQAGCLQRPATGDAYAPQAAAPADADTAAELNPAAAAASTHAAGKYLDAVGALTTSHGATPSGSSNTLYSYSHTQQPLPQSATAVAAVAASGMFIPWQQALQPHHLQHLQQHQVAAGPTQQQQCTPQQTGQQLQHTAAVSQGFGAFGQGLGPTAGSTDPWLLRSSSAALHLDLQQQQQQQQQQQVFSPGGRPLVHQISPSEATLLAAGAAAGIPQTSTVHVGPAGPLTQQYQQQPEQQQGGVSGRRRGSKARGLPPAWSGSGGPDGGSAGGGLDLASSSSIVRTSSGKVVRILTHPVTGKPLLLGPAVDAKTSRLGNTSLGAPAPQLFGYNLQSSKVQSAAAQVERHSAALGPLHEQPPHWLTPQQHHNTQHHDGYYLPDQYASAYPGSQVAFAATETGPDVSGAAGHPLVQQMGQYQAGSGVGGWVQGPGAAAPGGYVDDGLMGFQYQQQQ